MTVPPTRLYTADDLFAGWSLDDAASYATTFDGSTYFTAVQQGLRAPRNAAVATERALHDTAISRLLQDELSHDTVEPVAIMGGHAAPRGSAVYRTAAHLAGRLTSTGSIVLTGGGPGAMEAAHLGARLTAADRIDEGVTTIGADEGQRRFPAGAGRLVRNGVWHPEALALLHEWQGPAFRLAAETTTGAGHSIGIPTWLYGHEPPTPLATAHAKYFENSLREDGLLSLAYHGVIYLPGSAGTLQEIFQDLAQNHYRTVRNLFSPMVFFDIEGHWSDTYPVRPVIEALLRPQDRDLVLWTTDIDETVAFLDQFAPS